MIVSQPDRILLQREIASLREYMTGDLFDVGGGDGCRYQDAFPCVQHRSLDINPSADIVASADQIPLPDNSVDSILCSQMLEHVKNPQECLKEMCRILKPEGYAIVTVPQLNELHEEPLDFYRYTCHGLRFLSQQAGFNVKKELQRGKYHSLMCQNRIRRWIDLLHPYDNKWTMYFLAPLSKAYSSIALVLDELDTSESSQKHAIGWTFLLQKPR